MTISTLNIPETARWDLVALGEVMLRLDPGDERIWTTRSFRAWEGGGEYNVARSLKRCFRLETTIVTALADNPVGRLIEDLIYQGGIDRTHIVWLPYDGVGRSVRNGLNFTDRGFGVRAAVGMYDRGHSAASQLERGQVDWESIFASERARWFHTGGIFAALSDTTSDVITDAMTAARRHGAVVSYDLNFRPSLWASSGGRDRAIAVNRELAQFVDVLFGNEEDFASALGFEIRGFDVDRSDLDTSAFEDMVHRLTSDYPNVKVVATSIRRVLSASRNDWGAICWADGCFYRTATRDGLEILDRVGGGDGFAAGMIFGLLGGRPVDEALELGVAHGALAMTTPGDASMVTIQEVERLAAGASARIVR